MGKDIGSKDVPMKQSPTTGSWRSVEARKLKRE
jgi:hypothetical protein